MVYVQPRAPGANYWLSMSRYAARLAALLPATTHVTTAQASHVNMPRRFRPFFRRYRDFPPLPDRWPGGIDLVHFTDIYVVPHARRFDAARVGTVHDMIPLEFRKWWPPSGIYAAAVFERSLRSLKHLDIVIAPSENSRQRLLAATDLDEGRVHRVPVPVPEVFSPVPGPHERAPGTILSVGTIAEYKNIPGLLYAFAQPALKGARLIRIGSPFGPELLALARQLGVEGRIEERGFVSDEDLLFAMRECSVLAQPSFSEGFGMPVAEAMACVMPVVVSDGGALPEVAGGAGKIVTFHQRAPAAKPNLDDARDFAAAVAEVLDDRALQARMSEAGQREVERFRPAVVREQLKVAYCAALTSATRRSEA